MAVGDSAGAETQGRRPDRKSNEERMHPRQSLAVRTPLLKTLAYIGLDMTGPEGASKLQIGIYSLLLFIPIALIVRIFDLGGAWLFATSGVAIIPLAKVLGTATEELALRAGSGVGGLLNATFGNAVELIIAIFALGNGLYDVVQASITGSILGNLLFVLGFSIFMGGLGREKQTFNATVARATASQLILATMGLIVPAAFVFTQTTLDVPGVGPTQTLKEQLSIGVALILLALYVAQLFFFLRTHRHLYSEEEEMELHGQVWSVRHSIMVLLGTTLLVALMSEQLVDSLEEVTSQLHLTHLFVGVILVALIGNAAEHLTAVVVAMKDKMDLAVSIAMGSALQVALFVAPVLVLIGFAINRPLDLVFNLFEVATLSIAMLVVNAITQDGESNWFEGVQLLGAYAIVGIAFFFHG